MADAGSPGKDDRVLAPLRWTAIAIVPVLLAAFVILFVFPERTHQLWGWTIKPTMTAMVMGGGYLAGAWFFVRVARTKEGHRALPGLLGVTLFTTLLLVATIIHWDKFNHRHVSFWAWIFLYAVTPPLLPLLWWNNRKRDPGRLAPRDALVPAPIRVMMAVTGALVLVASVMWFVHPTLIMAHWPWKLTPLTTRTTAAFFTFPAVTWLLFAVDPRWSSFEIPMQTASIGMVMIMVAAIRASDQFSGDSAALYVALLGVALCYLVVVQVLMYRRAATTAPAAPPTGPVASQPA